MNVLHIDESGVVTRASMTAALRRLVLVDLTILARQYKNTGWSLKRPEEALAAFEQQEVALVVLPGDRLMAVSAGSPWFAEDVIVSEEFVGHGITTGEAITAMRQVAAAFGLSKIEVGTRATPGQRHEAAARLYQRQGMRVSSIVLEGGTNEQEGNQEGR